MTYEGLGEILGSAVMFAVIALVVFNILKHKTEKAKKIGVITFSALLVVKVITLLIL